MEPQEALRHRFCEGERVALVEDRASLEIYAGDSGVIELLYVTEPPGYEVTFRCRDGEYFGMICWEHELVAVCEAKASGDSA